MATFEEFLRPDGSDADTLAGRFSLDAFDRQISNQSEDDIAPVGSETGLQPGETPISRLIIIEDADHLGHIRQAYLRRMMEKIGATSPLHMGIIMIFGFTLKILLFGFSPMMVV